MMRLLPVKALDDRDYSENTQVLLSGVTDGEDGNHNDNNSEISTRTASCSEVHEFFFINNNNNNNIDSTCFKRGRLH